jgi:hypothetical protein
MSNSKNNHEDMIFENQVLTKNLDKNVMENGCQS